MPELASNGSNQGSCHKSLKRRHEAGVFFRGTGNREHAVHAVPRVDSDLLDALFVRNKYPETEKAAGMVIGRLAPLTRSPSPSSSSFSSSPSSFLVFTNGARRCLSAREQHADCDLRLPRQRSSRSSRSSLSSTAFSSSVSSPRLYVCLLAFIYGFVCMAYACVCAIENRERHLPPLINNQPAPS